MSSPSKRTKIWRYGDDDDDDDDGNDGSDQDAPITEINGVPIYTIRDAFPVRVTLTSEPWFELPYVDDSPDGPLLAEHIKGWPASQEFASDSLGATAVTAFFGHASLVMPLFRPKSRLLCGPADACHCVESTAHLLVPCTYAPWGDVRIDVCGLRVQQWNKDGRFREMRQWIREYVVLLVAFPHLVPARGVFRNVALALKWPAYVLVPQKSQEPAIEPC